MQIADIQGRNSRDLVFIVAMSLLYILGSGGIATAGYADSAHGNTSYGVDRSTPPCQYPNPSPPPDFLDCPTGSCAHCHDTFDSDICTGVTGGPHQLFAANDNDFCLKCHENTTNYATTAIVNRSYSYRAGGYTTDPVDDIREAFGSFSSHDLDDIKTFISGKWGYTAGSNACTACHNQHMAQGDPENAPNSAKSPSTRGWPVARPSEHNVGTWPLWGDDTTERMSAYTSNYQAPYRVGTSYEPDGSTTTDGSNLTDFNSFCTDCHNTTDTIYSTTLGRDLRQIDWDNEIHGKGDADEKLCGDNPYPSGDSGLGKVLSCLDCHEPHGSPNVTLIRKRVNASTVSSITTISQDDCSTKQNYNKEMSNLCNRCHKDDNEIDSGCTSDWWYKTHHEDDGDTGCNTDSPYDDKGGVCLCHYQASGHNWTCNNAVVSKIGCNCCHYHGSIRDDCDYEPYTRRTF